MKQPLLALLLAFFFMPTMGQSLKKLPIGKSGCQAYFFCTGINFETSYSPDSSAVYTGECTVSEVTYSTICVKLFEPVEPGAVSEELLINYLNFLKEMYKIKSSAGYGKGHTMTSNAKAVGVIDYWHDGENNDWKIKGWTDGKYLGVMMVFGKKNVMDDNNRVNIFLDGFRFPGS